VQITAVGNIGTKSGYKSRKWTKHGKLPYIEYAMTEDDEIASYVAVLQGAGIITDVELWKKKAKADKDIYWLLRKTAEKI
jgi:hypothetical protein